MPKESSTLHELSSKSFNKTPNGLIFSDTIQTLYSILLLCLDLKETNGKHNKIITAFSKYYPFSFHLDDALHKMRKLELEVEMTTTSINIAYNIKPELAKDLLKMFMKAKLLHTPADRTRSVPKQGVLLQPTPKGIAILQKYVHNIGLKTIPKILLSNLNSIRLFTFERSSVSDSIIHSEYLVSLLFIKAMGASPNVWAPTNPADTIPSLFELLDYYTETFSFENVQFADKYAVNGNGQRKSGQSWLEDLSMEELHDSKRKSPFAHKFFTNPDSDSHVQYYSSSVGLRLFKDRKFGSTDTIVSYSFTSKALWQWLMDCTDILYPKEATAVAALFVKMGLIIPVLLDCNRISRKRFQINRSAYYTLTKLGWDLIRWNSDGSQKKQSKSDNSKSDVIESILPRLDTNITLTGGHSLANETKSLTHTTDSELEETVIEFSHHFDSLDDILKDPGMRYLFREHLQKDICAENLDAYVEVKKFMKRMTLLKKLMDKSCKDRAQKKTSKYSVVVDALESSLTKNANECLELAYHIYSAFVMADSPCSLNIEHELREAITQVMLNPQSPIAKSFAERVLASSPISQHNSDKNLLDPNTTLVTNSILQKGITNSIVTIGSSTALTQRKKPKPLTIPTIQQTFDTGPPLMTPVYTANADINQILKLLKKLYPLYERIATNAYKMMNTDSFQKFLASDVYKEALSIIEYSR